MNHDTFVTHRCYMDKKLRMQTTGFESWLFNYNVEFTIIGTIHVSN